MWRNVFKKRLSGTWMGRRGLVGQGGNGEDEFSSLALLSSAAQRRDVVGCARALEGCRVDRVPLELVRVLAGIVVSELEKGGDGMVLWERMPRVDVVDAYVCRQMLKRSKNPLGAFESAIEAQIGPKALAVSVLMRVLSGDEEALVVGAELASKYALLDGRDAELTGGLALEYGGRSGAVLEKRFWELVDEDRVRKGFEVERDWSGDLWSRVEHMMGWVGSGESVKRLIGEVDDETKIFAGDFKMFLWALRSRRGVYEEGFGEVNSDGVVMGVVPEGMDAEMFDGVADQMTHVHMMRNGRVLDWMGGDVYSKAAEVLAGSGEVGKGLFCWRMGRFVLGGGGETGNLNEADQHVTVGWHKLGGNVKSAKLAAKKCLECGDVEGAAVLIRKIGKSGGKLACETAFKAYEIQRLDIVDFLSNLFDPTIHKYLHTKHGISLPPISPYLQRPKSWAIRRSNRNQARIEVANLATGKDILLPPPPPQHTPSSSSSFSPPFHPKTLRLAASAIRATSVAIDATTKHGNFFPSAFLLSTPILHHAQQNPQYFLQTPSLEQSYPSNQFSGGGGTSSKKSTTISSGDAATTSSKKPTSISSGGAATTSKKPTSISSGGAATTSKKLSSSSSSKQQYSLPDAHSPSEVESALIQTVRQLGSALIPFAHAHLEHLQQSPGASKWARKQLASLQQYHPVRPKQQIAKLDPDQRTHRWRHTWQALQASWKSHQDVEDDFEEDDDDNFEVVSDQKDDFEEEDNFEVAPSQKDEQEEEDFEVVSDQNAEAENFEVPPSQKVEQEGNVLVLNSRRVREKEEDEEEEDDVGRGEAELYGDGFGVDPLSLLEDRSLHRAEVRVKLGVGKVVGKGKRKRRYLVANPGGSLTALDAFPPRGSDPLFELVRSSDGGKEVSSLLSRDEQGERMKERPLLGLSREAGDMEERGRDEWNSMFMDQTVSSDTAVFESEQSLRLQRALDIVGLGEVAQNLCVLQGHSRKVAARTVAREAIPRALDRPMRNGENETWAKLLANPDLATIALPLARAAERNKDTNPADWRVINHPIEKLQNRQRHKK